MDENETWSTEESTSWKLTPLTASPSSSDAISLVSQIRLGRLEACSNSGRGVSEQRMSAMNDIMEALTEADAFITGVYGTQPATADVVERVTRRAHRDRLFDKVVSVSVAMKPHLKWTNLFVKCLRVGRRRPDLKRMQAELADALGFTMEEKSEANRAALLRERIKTEQKILVVVQHVYQGIDLQRLGIPFGDDHTGCKILLTSSSSPQILSNHMNAHMVFEADDFV